MSLALISLNVNLGALLVLVAVVAGFFVEHRHRMRSWNAVLDRQKRDFEVLNIRLASNVELLAEKLDSHLRLLVLTDGKAKESIAAVEASLHRLELIEVRMTAHDHRLAIIERSQEIVLDAARRAS